MSGSISPYDFTVRTEEDRVKWLHHVNELYALGLLDVAW
jgi:hypothetical protein